jgi:hypothetical protein
MVTISRFIPVWGIDPGPNQDGWRKQFVQWKNHGYGEFRLNIWRFPANICRPLDLELKSLSNCSGVTTERLQLLRRNCDEAGFG